MEQNQEKKDNTGYEKLLLILKIILNHLNIIPSENIGNISDGVKIFKRT